MSFFKEFKEFALRGNVMDMAVGVIVGGAFGKIVSSFINDLVMPPLGLLLGNADFSGLKATLKAAAADGKPVTLNYGLFLTNVVDFLIMALAVFLMVRIMNKLKKVPPPALPTQKKCADCAMAVPVEAKRCAYCGAAV